MNYYTTKTDKNLNHELNKEQGNQLFSRDINSIMSKQYFYSTYEQIYNNIMNQEKSYYYEDFTYNDKIRLHFDIDYEKDYGHELYKMNHANKIIDELIHIINNKINEIMNIINPRIIIMMSDGLHKLSLHITYPDIYFTSIYTMGNFVKDIPFIDRKIYKIGCFRMPLCNKFFKNNTLRNYKNINYIHKTDYQTFLDSCICYIDLNEIDKHYLYNNSEIDEIKPNKIKKENNYYYLDNDKEIYKEALIKSLSTFNLSEYNIWFLITCAIKDLYINVNRIESREYIYKIYDEECSKHKKYNKKENKRIFMKLDTQIDINYIFIKSDNDFRVNKIYKIDEIMFNPNKYNNIFIRNEEYISLTMEEINEYNIIFLKSPTGSRKTEITMEIVKNLKVENIISITSRVNLAGEHMTELKLELYKNLDYKNMIKSKKLVIQLESLYKCTMHNYNNGIVILDEINSLLTHLRSPTMNEKRALNFGCLVNIIKNAKYIICLDADLCDWNIQFIESIRNKNINNSSNKNNHEILNVDTKNNNIIVSQSLENNNTKNDTVIVEKNDDLVDIILVNDKDVIIKDTVNEDEDDDIVKIMVLSSLGDIKDDKIEIKKDDKFENKKDDKLLVYYNKFENKKDIPATIYECEFKMINEMMKLIEQGKFFIACFDSLKYMTKIIDYMCEKIKKENIIEYSSKIKYGLINTKEWKDKYVFYTPSILYGISYKEELTDVFCFIKKNHLNALQIYQMINRTRKINHMHINININQRNSKYNSLSDVKKEYELFELNLKSYQDVELNLIDSEREFYQLMYFNQIYMDSILKTNTWYYLLHKMNSLGFNITHNNEKNEKILSSTIKISKKEIKDNILEIFKIKKTELNAFQTNIMSSDLLIEKHFNLRAYLNNTVDKKISENIYKALFTESVKNRYVKIKMCIQFMKELGFNKLDEIINEKNEIRLCQECSLSLFNPIILEKKKKIRWCKYLCDKMIYNNEINDDLKKIYKYIKDGDIIICKKCQPILIDKVISNNILYKIPVILNKMNTIVKSEWINANLNNVKNMFEIRGEYKDKNYYTLYLLMATIIKQLFGSDILTYEQIYFKNDRYYIYNLNNDVINEHNKLINILDNNNEKFVLDISIFDDDDGDKDDNNEVDE